MALLMVGERVVTSAGKYPPPLLTVVDVTVS